MPRRLALAFLIVGCTPAPDRSSDLESRLPRSSGVSREPSDEEGTIAVRLDATTQWSAAMEVLRAASGDGKLYPAIVVRDVDGTLRRIPAWPHPLPDRMHHARPVPVRIDREWIDVGSHRATSLVEVHEIASRVHEAMPHETMVRVGAFDDATLQDVVDVLDAVRGPQCSLDGALAGDAVPDNCWFWQVAAVRLEP